MIKIIVTGAGGNASINFVKSLRMTQENYHIIGIDINKWHLLSNDVDERYIAPRVTDPDYLNILNTISEVKEVELLHPQPDVEVEFLSNHREEINTKVFLPSKEAISLCRDKFSLNQIPLLLFSRNNTEKFLNSIRESHFTFGHDSLRYTKITI